MESNINDQHDMDFLTERGRIEKLPKGGNHRGKLTDQQKESLCDILEEDCWRTIQRICDLFFERHNILIGRSTATRCFRDFHYTLKVLRPIPERRNDPQNILARKEYAINFLRIAPDRQKVFFIDETGFQVNMICRYGRELTGVRTTRVVPALRSRNYSVACTMSCEGMVNFKIRERAYNAECFLEYLLEILEIFRAREISETYLSLSQGQPTSPPGICDASLMKSRIYRFA
ncbi:hypothetical protein RF11_13435 [Thelohanellus kitauei]|uniref:Uncharacterized protein n=1 Tax=Thelohanellus kitauei TaxID=669202 RepID=A0A0C2N6E9_THEKT|nr:hypothetical protein RF11_13435 [Thelohanellus kitauei]